MIKALLLLLFCSLANPVFAYSYSRTITIDHNQVPNTDQASFPILVCANSAAPCNATVTGLNQSGAGAHVQNSNGYDIGFFTNSNCATKVTAWEVELYTASTGELIVWINDGTISHTVDTTFYMCYGDLSISVFQSTASSVWNSDYQLVNHLPNGSSLSLTDSTSNNRTATTHGATATAGKIDGGASFNAGTPPTTYSVADFFDGATARTYSFWMKPTSLPAGGNLVTAIGKRWNDDEMALYIDSSGKLQPVFRSLASGIFINFLSTTGISTGVWSYLVFTYDGTTARAYLNGAANGTQAASASIYDTADDYYFGEEGNGTGRYFIGLMDEIRVSGNAGTGVRSADWIATEYNNQAHPNDGAGQFYSVSTETVITPVFIINNSIWRNFIKL